MSSLALAIREPRGRLRRRAVDFLALTKPRVVLMVLVTASVGFYMASPVPPNLRLLVHTLLGVALAAGGTLALNQYLERDVDAKMARTRHRPLPDGRLRPEEALGFGLGMSATGMGYLAVAVNPSSALVTGLTTASYLFVYTPLKRRSVLCTVLGAVPGALPPVAGWAAARGEFASGAWVLFGILFVWQLPHALAIASVYRSAYVCAGLRFTPIVDPGGGGTARQVLLDCLALLAVGLLPTLVGMAGPLYFLGALVLGVGMLVFGLSLAVTRSVANARRLVYASLVYLPSLLFLMAIDRIPL
ncbi:MAG: protoheme IX farnesyltransferase [candidate division NC10 bacterium]|nr:protoheme IX farnesyltransferase [candidate division NC10 bacterium]